jgi:hypothetical protein
VLGTIDSWLTSQKSAFFNEKFWYDKKNTYFSCQENKKKKSDFCFVWISGCRRINLFPSSLRIKPKKSAFLIEKCTFFGAYFRLINIFLWNLETYFFLEKNPVTTTLLKLNGCLFFIVIRKQIVFGTHENFLQLHLNIVFPSQLFVKKYTFGTHLQLTLW